MDSARPGKRRGAAVTLAREDRCKKTYPLECWLNDLALHCCGQRQQEYSVVVRSEGGHREALTRTECANVLCVSPYRSGSCSDWKFRGMRSVSGEIKWWRRREKNIVSR